ncbi:cupin domain-containing protein [Psychrobacter sp. DM8]|uniref:cupin domain-containing protein n=1 Tax=Psychrobacter sp. DM8 TaxID=3440636 RepID=UPI003F4FAAC9
MPAKNLPSSKHQDHKTTFNDDEVSNNHTIDSDDNSDDEACASANSLNQDVDIDNGLDNEAENDGLDTHATPQKSELQEENIGKKVNQLRLAKGYSQRKLARMAGLTNTSISSIERNKVSPAVNTLKAILEVLGSDLTTFFSDEWQAPKARVVVTPKDLLEISEPGCRVSLKQVYNHSTTKNLGFLIETYQPNSSTEEKIAHEGEEIGTVIEGKILIRIDETTYLLNKGDSYVIDTNRPHTFMNPSDSIARVISAHTPTTY